MMTSGSDEAWFLEYEGRRIDLREGEVTLGRSRGCGVVLRDPSALQRAHGVDAEYLQDVAAGDGMLSPTVARRLKMPSPATVSSGRR